MPRSSTSRIPLAICTALALAGCAAHAQDRATLAPSMAAGAEAPLLVMVEQPPARIGDADRARLVALARRANDPDLRDWSLVVTAGAEAGPDGSPEQGLAALSARTVRDLLVDVGGIAPARIRSSVARRPDPTGAVTVALAAPQARTSAAPGVRPGAPARVLLAPMPVTVATGHRPAGGFHAGPAGNRCAFARHDLDDFQPGGPFLPCAPPAVR